MIDRSRPEARPSKRGLSSSRLARMHDVLQRHVDSGRVSGLVALLSRRGLEHVDAIGALAFDRTAPMQRDTIFRLASVTKPITAVAAMILVEECTLKLDDPVVRGDFLLPRRQWSPPSWAPCRRARCQSCATPCGSRAPGAIHHHANRGCRPPVLR
jgi:hypothetical protein